MILTGVYVGNLETLYCKEEIKKANNGYYNFNVRLDEHLRTEATQILANYGLLPIQAIKLFFDQLVATHKIPLSFDCQAIEKQLTAKLLSAISELGYLSFLFLHH